jgi:hypothetical protein
MFRVTASALTTNNPDGPLDHPASTQPPRRPRCLHSRLPDPDPRPRRTVHSRVRHRLRRRRHPGRQDPSQLPASQRLCRTLRGDDRSRTHRPSADLRTTPPTPRARRVGPSLQPATASPRPRPATAVTSPASLDRRAISGRPPSDPRRPHQRISHRGLAARICDAPSFGTPQAPGMRIVPGPGRRLCRRRPRGRPSPTPVPLGHLQGVDNQLRAHVVSDRPAYDLAAERTAPVFPESPDSPGRFTTGTLSWPWQVR